MCGLSAIFNLRKQRQDDVDNRSKSQGGLDHMTVKLDRSVEAQRHRGPDAKGVWISPNEDVGLAHVRLSTRDLSSAGHQPLHSSNPADDIHVVVNGELYYEPELRTQLMQSYTFSSTSDSEMAIALYKQYGTGFLEHLRGEFSLVLYDGNSESFVVARDRFGVKPLHYGIFGDKLLVATQCKGVVELLDDKNQLQWDVTCLAEGGGHYGSRTLFEGISKVPPGHFAIVRQNNGEQIEFKPYWRTTYPTNAGQSDTRPTNELIEQLRTELLEAIRLRVVSSDVPIGLLLSGGVDSSAVAGMAAEVARYQLQKNNGDAPPLPTCFTIAFPDEGEFDESAVAVRTAEHLGLPIEKIVVTEQVLADEFEESCWLGEALLWDLQHIAKKAMSKHISKRGLKVVLNGDGADELFGGYTFFASDRLVADDEFRAPEMQSTTTQQREKAESDYIKNLKWFGVEQTESGQDNQYARALGLPPAYCKLAVQTNNDWLPKELRDRGDPFRAMYDCFNSDEIRELGDLHPMHRAMWVWRKTVLPNMVIAAISDGAEMAHSVESRPPFLDHVVAELAQTFSVDPLVHVEGDQRPTEKWIFREAVKPYVTDEVYRRRKQPFAAPFRWKKGGPLYAKLSSLITRENVENLGFAVWDQCGSLLDKCYEEEDQSLFRKMIWLAQIISIGLQFDVQTWTSALIEPKMDDQVRSLL